MIKRQRVTDLWVVMFDSDGGESDPEGPFESHEDANQYALLRIRDNWRWVTYEIQEGDE